MDPNTQILLMSAAGVSGGGGDGWWLSYGGTSADYVDGVITDSSGNIYIVGYGFSVQASPYSGGFVAKFDKDGILLWQRQLTKSATTIEPRRVAVDSSDAVYIAGYSTAISGPDFMLIKYNSAGTFQWQRYIGTGSSYSDEGRDLVIQGSDIYVVGKMFPNVTSGTDPAIVKYNTSGTFQWQRTIAETLGQGQYYAVVAKGASDIFTAGVYPGGGLWHLKYNSAGTIQYQRRLTNTSTYARGIDYETATGDYYVAGQGSTSTGLIVKYNSSGTLQWQRELSTGSEWSSIRLDESAGMLYVCGGTSLAKYSTAGALQWERNLDFGGGTKFSDIDVKSANHIYLVGRTNAVGQGNTDGVVIKYPKTGAITGSFGALSITVGVSAASTPTYTDSSTSLTASTPTMSQGTLNLTDAAATLTASAVTPV